MNSQTIPENVALDIVGDVHGCLDELLELLAALGYRVERAAEGFAVAPPPGRALAFVGDLVNRGPATVDVLRLAMSITAAGQAYCVAGNQDMALLEALRGTARKTSPAVAHSLQELMREPAEFRAAVVDFLAGLPGHLVGDCGRLAIAHAGLKEQMIGDASAATRAFAVHGETTGEKDEFGHPVRVNWAASYHGRALVVYGHTPVVAPAWLNNTVNIDTGCVYGGHLTALRYPERQTTSVAARAIHSLTRRRFPPNDTLAAER
jgi:protein phosphatase